MNSSSSSSGGVEPNVIADVRSHKIILKIPGAMSDPSDSTWPQLVAKTRSPFKVISKQVSKISKYEYVK